MIVKSFESKTHAEADLRLDGFRRCNGECSDHHFVRHDVAWIQHANIQLCEGHHVRVMFTQEPK